MPDPERDGNARPWRFPPGEDHPRATVDRCPLQYIQIDTWALVRAAGLSEGRLSFSELSEMPGPYLQAWAMYTGELAMASAARAAEARRRHQAAK